MRKFYNPMAGLVFVIIELYYIGLICFDLVMDFYLPTPVYVSLSIMFILLLLVVLLFEHREAKKNKVCYEEFSACLNEYLSVGQVKKQLKQISKKIITVITAAACLVGILTLFAYETVSSIFCFVTALFIFYIGIIYKGNFRNTADYIMSQKKQIRTALIKIHEIVCEKVPYCVCGSVLFPNYIISGRDSSCILFAVRALEKENKISVYFPNTELFTVFEDRLRSYKITEEKGILFSAEAVDYQLLKEMIMFHADCICL